MDWLQVVQLFAQRSRSSSWATCVSGKACGIRVEDGGWHFGYMGGHGEKDVKKRVAEKVRSAAHQEYNKAEVLSDVADRIKDGKDIFGRNASFVRLWNRQNLSGISAGESGGVFLSDSEGRTAGEKE